MEEYVIVDGKEADDDDNGDDDDDDAVEEVSERVREKDKLIKIDGLSTEGEEGLEKRTLCFSILFSLSPSPSSSSTLTNVAFEIASCSRQNYAVIQ
jgi:hypothetical protein